MTTVVVTGMGAVSLGTGSDALIEGLLAGRSGIGAIDLFDTATLPTRIAGQAPLPEGWPLPDRKIAFALEASRQAYEQAWGRGAAPAGGGVSMGVGLELFAMEDLAHWRQPDFQPHGSLSERLSFLQTPSDLCVHLIAQRYRLHTPPLVHVSACAAGSDAIGSAYRLVKSGRRRWMMAGGSDSMINPLGVAGFCALNATTRRNEAPERASRPFDKQRDGFVMGEGAAMLVLETLQDARARGAPIVGAVVGYGGSLDAHKISDPHPDGRGAFEAMASAVADAGLTPHDIDAIDAHGTSTPKNDPAESRAIETLLGERALAVPVSASKSMIGHLISAAGAVEAIAALGCMARGKVHPTLNLDEPDPSCGLDYVADGAREHAQRFVLSSSFGFGGHNAALVLQNGDDVAFG